MKYNVLVRIFDDHISWQKSLGWGMPDLERATAKLRKGRTDLTPMEEHEVVKIAKLYLDAHNMKKELDPLVKQIKAERQARETAKDC